MSEQKHNSGPLEWLTGIVTVVIIGYGVLNIAKSLGVPNISIGTFSVTDFAISPLAALGLLLLGAAVYTILGIKKLPIIMAWFGTGAFAFGGAGTFLIALLNLPLCNGQGADNSSATWDATQKCYIHNPFPLAPTEILFGTGLWVVIIMVLYMVTADHLADKAGRVRPYSWPDGD